MVHGILQFTPSIAFRYVLHRCESRDIRCRELFLFQKKPSPQPALRERDGDGQALVLVFLGAFRAGVRFCGACAPTLGQDGSRLAARRRGP